MERLSRRRILHLVDWRGGAARPTVFAQMAAVMRGLSGYSHRTLIVGPPHLAEEARQAGLGPPTLEWAQTVGVPFGRLLPAIPAVRRKLRMHRGVDLFHCWSVRSALICQLLRPRTPRVLQLTAMPDLDDLAMLKRLLAGDRKPTTQPTTKIVLTQTMAEVLNEHGLADERIHIIGPMIDQSGTGGRTDESVHSSTAAVHDRVSARDRIRQRWGIDHTDAPPTIVAALLADPAQVGDTVEGLMTLGLAQRCLDDAPDSTPATTPRLRLLVHPSQHRRELGVEQAEANQWYDAMIQDAAVVRPWQVLGGCDLAIDVGGYAGISRAGPSRHHGGFDVNGHRLAPALETGAMTTAWALTAGLPIVTPRHDLSQTLEHGAEAYIARGPAPKALALWVVDLARDAERRKELGKAAVTHARKAYATARWLAMLERIYHDSSAR